MSVRWTAMTFEEALDELDSRVLAAKEREDWTEFWPLLAEANAMRKLRSDGYA